MEKAWLSQQELEYVEKNIVEDPEALEELEKLDVYSTPATIIDGVLIVGFNRKKIAELLDLG
jgi:thioredoxin reductase (NADPH)